MLKFLYETIQPKLLCKRAIFLLAVALVLSSYCPLYAQLAQSPWPAFRHDSQHTGRSPFVGAKEGELKWRLKTIANISSSPAIGKDGTIYVGDNYSFKVFLSFIFNFGFFYAINPDGALKWFLPTGSIYASSPAIASDGTIYIVSSQIVAINEGTSYLYAINSDGTIKWTHETGKGLSSVLSSSSPTIADDGTIYVGTGEGYLCAFNPDGSIRWQYRTLGQITASPVLDEAGNIYIGSYNQFYSLTPDGSLRWSFKAAPFTFNSSAAIAQDGTIYVACSIQYGNTGVLFSLNPEGIAKWHFTLTYKLPLFTTSSPALDSNGTIYVGDDDYFYAINPDGSLKWRYNIEGTMLSSPAIDADGKVYFVTAKDSVATSFEKGSIYALNSDGTLIWQYENFDGSYSSPAIAEDGTIYVGSREGYLYSFGEN